MDTAAYNEAAKIVPHLPQDDGLVTIRDRTGPDNDTVRVWAVEFPQQTILLQFIFDATEEQERAYAELIAKGPNLLRYFAEYCANKSSENDALLKAFNITFNALVRKNDELENELSQILDNQEDETELPTVGEK